MKLKVRVASIPSNFLLLLKRLFPSLAVYTSTSQQKLDKYKTCNSRNVLWKQWKRRGMAKIKLASKKSDHVIVAFSGGSDSTLTAYFVAKYFKKVDLVTFVHSGMQNIKNSSTSYKLLCNKLGNKKFSHTFIDIEDVMEEGLKCMKLKNLLLNYGLLSLNICFLCTLCMHMTLNTYAQKQNIKYTIGGYAYDPNLRIKKWNFSERLHANFGITLLPNPRKFILDPDAILYKEGVTREQKIKQTPFTSKIQPLCHFHLCTALLKTYYPLFCGNQKLKEVDYKLKEELFSFFSPQIVSNYVIKEKNKAYKNELKAYFLKNNKG